LLWWAIEAYVGRGKIATTGNTDDQRAAIALGVDPSARTILGVFNSGMQEATAGILPSRSPTSNTLPKLRSAAAPLDFRPRSVRLPIAAQR
jgi:hypothetical protein